MGPVRGGAGVVLLSYALGPLVLWKLSSHSKETAPTSPPRLQHNQSLRSQGLG